MRSIYLGSLCLLLGFGGTAFAPPSNPHAPLAVDITMESRMPGVSGIVVRAMLNNLFEQHGYASPSQLPKNLFHWPDAPPKGVKNVRFVLTFTQDPQYGRIAPAADESFACKLVFDPYATEKSVTVVIFMDLVQLRWGVDPLVFSTELNYELSRIIYGRLHYLLITDPYDLDLGSAQMIWSDSEGDANARSFYGALLQSPEAIREVPRTLMEAIAEVYNRNCAGWIGEFGENEGPNPR